MIDGSGSGSVTRTNGSGRPKNIWIPIRIRLRNTAKNRSGSAFSKTSRTDSNYNEFCAKNIINLFYLSVRISSSSESESTITAVLLLVRFRPTISSSSSSTSFSSGSLVFLKVIVSGLADTGSEFLSVLTIQLSSSFRFLADDVTAFKEADSMVSTTGDPFARELRISSAAGCESSTKRN
jgi:hypothetical protein